MKYKKLETEFTKKGFNFKQSWRVGDFAIFERKNKTSSKAHFEAIKVTRHDGYEIAGTKIEPSECYPNAEAWGYHGFTCPTIERAKLRIKEMRDNPEDVKTITKNKK